MNVELYIEGVRIDLYDNEGINIKLNSQDINDISKVNAGYTKDFSVPASKVNNTFFKHYYNADIIGGFDARTKKKATIYLDDLFFISGKIRLTSTSLKDNNNIVDYRIQFEGEVVNIKDLLADRKLKDLDLSQYNHIYNSDNVGAGLSSSLFNGSVIYPLISSVNRWVYDSSNAFVNTENTKNIHFESDNVEQGINYNELKPAVRISDIVNKIQLENDLTFVGDFFNRDYYNNLYLWFSNDAGKMDINASTESNLINWDSGDDTFINLSTDSIDLEDMVNRFVGFRNFELTNSITLPSNSQDTLYSYVITIDDVEVYRQDNIKGDSTITFIYTSSFGLGELKFFLESSNVISYECDLQQIAVYQKIEAPIPPADVVIANTTASLTNIAGQVVLSNQAPDIKQIDIIIGLLKMFNIALTPQIDGSILWETLPEFYQNGKEFKDFEKYIELDKTIIKRGKLLSEFDFRYQEPTTVLGVQFKKNNIDAYGDLTEELLDDNDNLLDGGKLEIELPFENMVYERLRDLADNQNTPIQYGLSTDENINPVVPKNLIMYIDNEPQNDVGFIDDTGTVLNLQNGNVNYPNHCISLTNNTKQSLNWSSELSTFNFGLMNQTLYNSFYSDYVSDIFSPQRRVYTFDAVIPNFILASINLNDRLIIGNKRYLINSINSNLTTQKTKLELINDIYSAGDLIGEQFYANPTLINAVVNGGVYQSTIYNNAETVLSLVDEGNGIFASIEGATTINGVVTKNFNVQPNATGVQRVMSILCTKGTETFKIVILQESN